jgi:N-acetylglucosaminyldiphosphoundecaprenol N-acetyl-beta-D-mannosaminyltransferase
MRKTIEILGVNIDTLSMKESIEKILRFLNEDRAHSVYTPNSEIIMEALRDPHFREILNRGDMVTADGAGVVLAARILGLPLPQKVSGIDLVRELLPVAAKNGIPFYLLGGRPGVAQDAAKNLMQAYPGLDIRGYSHGYFTPDKEKELIEEINRSGANIVIVAMGAPRQEKWIHKNLSVLKPRVCMGAGGTLDVFAGRTKLAPECIRRWGLEWLYRLCKEPWRYKRMLSLPLFIFRVIAERIRSLFR